MFEGEYLNGKKWKGKGMEYFYDDFTGDLEFKIKVEYFNGFKRNIKGKNIMNIIK